jgi:hypothetical protein
MVARAPLMWPFGVVVLRAERQARAGCRARVGPGPLARLARQRAVQARHTGVQVGPLRRVHHRLDATRRPEAQEGGGNVVHPRAAEHPRVPVEADALGAPNPLQEGEQRTTHGLGGRRCTGFAHEPQGRAASHRIEARSRMRLLGSDERVDLDASLAIQLQLDQGVGALRRVVVSARTASTPVGGAQDLPDGPRCARQLLAFQTGSPRQVVR